MDKIFSTRLDESIVVELERVTKRHGMTKKRFLEDAIRAHVRQISTQDDSDVWTDTFGTWQRKESATQTVKKARDTFQKNMSRHHR